MGPEQVLPLRVSEEIRVMAMNGYFKLPKFQELESHHQMYFNDICRGGELTPLKRYCQRILQLQPNVLALKERLCVIQHYLE